VRVEGRSSRGRRRRKSRNSATERQRPATSKLELPSLWLPFDLLSFNHNFFTFTANMDDDMMEQDYDSQAAPPGASGYESMDQGGGRNTKLSVHLPHFIPRWTPFHSSSTQHLQLLLCERSGGAYAPLMELFDLLGRTVESVVMCGGEERAFESKGGGEEEKGARPRWSTLYRARDCRESYLLL